MPDPFLTLNVRENATDKEVREAYRLLVQRFPPEQHPEKFRIIAEAYDAIKDEVSRAERRVFGNLQPGMTLSELVPDLPSDRRRIGLDRWLEPFGGDRKEG